MHRVLIQQNALSGCTKIPAGEYLVAVRAGTRQINLQGMGREIGLNAMTRPNRGSLRGTVVSFSPAGGVDEWLLQVKIPKQGEYFSVITYAGK